MTDLIVDGVSKRYGGRDVVRNLSFTVRSGELFAILGPSGCGKTTALRIIAGLAQQDSGRVRLGDRDLTGLPPEARDASMVFQNYALFPHLSVGDNVGFGLKARGVSSSASRTRVVAVLHQVGLAGYEAREVGNLSGGEQQRVALARAIVVEPALLLLDEPMSNLDQKLREGTRKDLRALQKRLGITTLYVTHDQHEAMEMADRVAVLRDGRIEQIGSPREVYDRPRNAFVATFLGHANVLEAIRLEPEHSRGGQVAIRPENVHLGDVPGGHIDLGTGRLVSEQCQGPTRSMVVELVDSAIPISVLELNRGERAAPGVGELTRVSVHRSLYRHLEADVTTDMTVPESGLKGD